MKSVCCEEAVQSFNGFNAVYRKLFEYREQKCANTIGTVLVP